MFAIIGDHSVWGTGRNHIQNDSVCSTATLCGKHLEMQYKAVQDDSRRFLHGFTKEEVLKHDKSICKLCLKYLKNIL